MVSGVKGEELDGPKDFFDWLAAVPEIPNDERGVEHTAPCPCGGTIRAIRSRYNGHLHAWCDKCKWRLME